MVPIPVIKITPRKLIFITFRTHQNVVILFNNYTSFLISCYQSNLILKKVDPRSFLRVSNVRNSTKFVIPFYV